ncbi:hypothetical protein RI367_005651 [Sorochytrium milnesiophthora]
MSSSSVPSKRAQRLPLHDDALSSGARKRPARQQHQDSTVPAQSQSRPQRTQAARRDIAENDLAVVELSDDEVVAHARPASTAESTRAAAAQSSRRPARSGNTASSQKRGSTLKKAAAATAARYSEEEAMATATAALLPPVDATPTDDSSGDTCSICRRSETESKHLRLLEWVSCDECGHWYHAICLHTSFADISRLYQWRCPTCVGEKGLECHADAYGKVIPQWARVINDRMRELYKLTKQYEQVDLEEYLSSLVSSAISYPQDRLCKLKEELLTTRADAPAVQHYPEGLSLRSSTIVPPPPHPTAPARSDKGKGKLPRHDTSRGSPEQGQTSSAVDHPAAIRDQQPAALSPPSTDRHRRPSYMAAKPARTEQPRKVEPGPGDWAWPDYGYDIGIAPTSAVATTATTTTSDDLAPRAEPYMPAIDRQVAAFSPYA